MPAIKSTCLSSADYDPQAETLTLTFKKDGSVYTYHGVSQAEYANLMNAGSKGGEFNADIRNDYPYERH
jgi:hypothetical protein